MDGALGRTIALHAVFAGIDTLTVYSIMIDKIGMTIQAPLSQLVEDYGLDP